MGLWNNLAYAFAFVLLWTGSQSGTVWIVRSTRTGEYVSYYEFTVALAVSIYLAAISCASNNLSSEPDEYNEYEKSDDGYIISADDLEMIIRDVYSLGRNENGDDEWTP